MINLAELEHPLVTPDLLDDSLPELILTLENLVPYLKAFLASRGRGLDRVARNGIKRGLSSVIAERLSPLTISLLWLSDLSRLKARGVISVTRYRPLSRIIVGLDDLTL